MQRLYLSEWEYNAARILTAVGELVVNEGGKVKLGGEFLVSDRRVVKVEPIAVTHRSCISFVLDEVFYYFQLDPNPLFDFRWVKTPVRNGKYYTDTVMDGVSDKGWLPYKAIKSNCEQTEIVSIARAILRMLRRAGRSKVLDTTKFASAMWEARACVPSTGTPNSAEGK